MGTIYKRGNLYWIQYSRRGKVYRESSGSDKRMVAKGLLAKREGEIAKGKTPGIHFEKVKFDELAEDLLTDYRINQKKSTWRAEISVENLKKHFKGFRVVEISTAAIKSYIEKRLEEGAANATINRELSALKRMLSLGAQCTPPKVDRVPHISMLKENNARKGFFEHHEFLALRDSLPPYVKGVATFAYRTGWRLAEILDLEWSQVDRQNGIVYLNPGETKNDDARTVYLDDELRGLLRYLWEKRIATGTILPYVFLNKSGTGKVSDFRGAWKRACKNAGIGQRLFHDFRRTAVRNLVRASIPERVAMQISGHKTRSVFERYNIVSDEDLRMAAGKQQAYLETQTDTISSTVVNFPTKKGADQNSQLLDFHGAGGETRTLTGARPTGF